MTFNSDFNLKILTMIENFKGKKSVSQKKVLKKKGRPQIHIYTCRCHRLLYLANSKQHQQF